MVEARQHPGAGAIRLAAKRFRAIWLRWRGWQCEGPFPGRRSSAVLIAGPGLEEGGPWTDLLEARLGFRGRWWTEGGTLPATPHPQAGHPGLLIVPYASPYLDDVLRTCAAEGIPIHLTSLAHRHRRIRCNTPMMPGPFTQRERSYIARLYSYRH